jgi:ribonucleoside-diphosphate reductase alpha chain
MTKFTNVVPEMSAVARQVMGKRYLFPEEKDWADAAKRVVGWVLGEDDPDYQDMLELMTYRYFLPNSPGIFNAGIDEAGLAACFVVALEDSTEGILKTFGDFMHIARKGGGVGTSLSRIRPKGAPVGSSSHGYAIGPVAIIDSLCVLMKNWTQNGKRPLAQMTTMSVYHPDIKEFITAKAEEGRMSTTNMSVVVDNAFMQAVLDNGTYWTSFDGVAYEELYAREVFSMIVRGAWQNGEPGLLFYDRINDGPYKYSGQEIIATNPSMMRGTKIITDLGVLPIEQLEGKTFRVRNLHGEWSPAECFLSGKNKKLFKVSLSGGAEYYATKEHKWPVVSLSGIQKTTTLELQPGDRLPVSQAAKVFGSLGNYSDGFLVGWIYGDGWITERTDDGTQQVGIIVSDDDAKHGVLGVLAEKMRKIGVDTSWPMRSHGGKSWHEVSISNRKLNSFLRMFGVTNKKNGLPKMLLNECSEEFSYGFLDGLISSDGSVDENRVTITTAHETLAKELTEFIGMLGIPVNRQHTDSVTNFTPIGQISSVNRIVFSTRFVSGWRLTHSGKQARIVKREKSRSNYFKKVISVVETDLVDSVWDIRVFDDTHCFSLPNVITGNCGEMPLPSNGICNLGSLDLAKFHQNGHFDWRLYGEAIRLAVRFLDRVIDKTGYPTEEIKQWSLKNRPVGLGWMGWADLLLKEGVAYGSDESIKMAKMLVAETKNVAISESEILGKVKGVPEACKNLPRPRRNVTVLTMAPTGSISLLADTSSGIEPTFSATMTRTDGTGTYSISHPEAHQPYFRVAVSDGNAAEVTWEEHIRMLAAIQNGHGYPGEGVDSGVSKTINMPFSSTEEDVAGAYMLAWQLGCKGVTVYRQNSRSLQVLTAEKSPSEKVCPECGGHIVKESGCEKCERYPECEYMLCTIG